MMPHLLPSLGAALTSAALLVPVVASAAPTALAVPEGRPEATVDLATPEGVSLIEGRWRHAAARIVEIDHRADTDVPVLREAQAEYAKLKN